MDFENKITHVIEVTTPIAKFGYAKSNENTQIHIGSVCGSLHKITPSDSLVGAAKTDTPN